MFDFNSLELASSSRTSGHRLQPSEPALTAAFLNFSISTCSSFDLFTNLVL